jgi:hypothetical protein
MKEMPGSIASGTLCISLLNILRNDSTNEGNRGGETEGNCLSHRKYAGGKTGFVIYETAFASYCIILF